jgi:U3 small nucleolar RNA-associated protein 21
MYNLQSGQHRRRFPVRLKQAEVNKMRLEQLEAEDAVGTANSSAASKFAKGQGRHKAAITGLAVDSLNRVLVSCGEDGKVKVGDCTSSMHVRSNKLSVLGLQLRSTPSRD